MLALAALLVLASPLERFECARCHELPAGTAPAVDDDKSCVRCHRAIESGTFPTSPEHLARWQKELTHLIDVPALEALDGRVRRAWLERFLLEPNDLRPALEETMPRLPLTRDDARAIARALVPHEPDEGAITWPLSSTIARGERVFHDRCASCHRFGALGSASAPLAPDLRFARDRMPPRALDAWLRAPRGRMPLIPLDDDDRLAVVRFLVEAPLPPAIPRPLPARLPVLERRVTWDEVNARVFRRGCWHCHSDASLAGGDGGPGNTGGFGYAGKGLSLASWSEAMVGGMDDDGAPRSIAAPTADGPLAGIPRVLAHLLARQREEAELPTGGVVGMPLGLPALSPEDIQLVESWIAQGRPRGDPSDASRVPEPRE